MLLEKLTESGLIGEVEYIRYLLNRGLRGLQQHLGLDDQGVVNPMSAEETEHISGQFSILREKMKLRTHFFQKEALQNALVGFFIVDTINKRPLKSLLTFDTCMI